MMNKNSTITYRISPVYDTSIPFGEIPDVGKYGSIQLPEGRVTDAIAGVSNIMGPAQVFDVQVFEIDGEEAYDEYPGIERWVHINEEWLMVAATD